MPDPTLIQSIARCAAAALALEATDIKPATRLADLVPRAQRRTLHQKLTAELQTETLPDLERPDWLLCLCAVASLILGFLVARAVFQSFGSGFGVLMVLVAVFLQAIAWLATFGLRREYPSAIATVGNLSGWIMMHKSERFAPDKERKWTREEVSVRVREIVIEELGCANAYSEDARFIEDLGMG